ncbi:MULTISPECIES: UbiH/UbiF/VisC/COQ6 family ubiquinone biosynthesis hydroxylase [unclassified Duganella]|uniref:UbiH/UbiF/VisC/COQ6 family ubiquinone biosynthesis hydroxylase n=1 Tax=unclassified Duganella TaxID=2636909 RepID=UPI000E34323E|nr:MULTISPECIES: UbiH/UbiF/VisC/COQ6 family ubiquinone biosynthesis hydroxylase [unclassified Duganella]RFP11261.1 UbiH/UbiF/VisC/COQ6 family ubiquinone biosynthesis hydroxylase [Duganella sp. BJB475]RFP29580.1 UbiH/UbiF/VisC/COQ6 family ubiquinone biosynthesis hydroxylase [Duganella sp. BJB476]
MTDTTFEVAICGAGPAGMALAALLAKRGTPAQRIALIDAKTLEQASKDPRSIALSWGSRQILEEIGAWPVAATAIHQIHVSRRGQFGRSLIDRDEHKLPALGYVLRYGDLVTALGAVCERAGIATLRPARVEAIDEGADAVALTIAGADSSSASAAIVVQAEGGLFSDQESKAQHRDYQQTAIIAQVRSSRPIAHRAYERFTEQGPLALLPQGEDYSLVWCVRPDTAARLQALDDAAFLAELGAAFGERVGSFTHASPRLAFPLGLNADPRSSARTVAIGNAAQTLHPVAGQGLNLGLRDVAVLARLLAQGANPTMLAQFTELRRQDRDTTVRLTDTMARIFANDSPAQALLGLSLAAIDMVGPARGVLAELMMYGRR